MEHGRASVGALAILVALSGVAVGDEPTPPESSGDGVALNGGFWLNYTLNAFDDTDVDKGGDFGPGNSMFRLGFDGHYSGVVGSFRARWYSYARVWEYGWVGYRWRNEAQLEVGLTKVPFGVLPYSSYDYWFNIPYYIGLNNQHDVGLKWSGDIVEDLIELQVGLFKSSDIAAADDLARFSYDTVVVAGDPLARNEETNQVSARLAATFHGLDVGGSVQYGGLYNHDTRDTGRHWAAALHAAASYGGVGVQVQAMQYAFRPKNAVGVARDVVFAGAFADAFPIAARGRVLEANVAYDIRPGGWIDTIRVYNNHSILWKDEETFATSEMNIVGASVLAGPIFGFVDLVSARNAPYIGAPTAIAFTTGEPSVDWHSMFNINIGFYFKTDVLASPPR